MDIIRANEVFQYTYRPPLKGTFDNKKVDNLVGVTDLIYRIVQVLREDLERLTVSARDAGLMEPVEPWDEG